MLKHISMDFFGLIPLAFLPLGGVARTRRRWLYLLGRDLFEGCEHHDHRVWETLRYWSPTVYHTRLGLENHCSRLLPVLLSLPLRSRKVLESQKLLLCEWRGQSFNLLRTSPEGAKGVTITLAFDSPKLFLCNRVPKESS